MTEAKWISIPLPKGEAMDGYHVAAQTPGRAPLVLVLQEIFGVNNFVRQTAHELAAEGFEVLAPDLFWRAGRRIDLDYTPEARAQAGKLMQEFDTGQGLADINAAIRLLGRKAAEVGAVGFCLGGKLATLLGAHGDIGCGVSFYGVQLEGHVDEIAKAKSRLLLQFGEADAQIPLKLVNEIASRSAKNAKVEIEIHGGAGHGFFNSLRAERYHAEAAAQAGARMRAMLHECLSV